MSKLTNRLAQVHRTPAVPGSAQSPEPSLTRTMTSWLAQLPQHFEDPAKQRQLDALDIGSLPEKWKVAYLTTWQLELSFRMAPRMSNRT